MPTVCGGLLFPSPPSFLCSTSSTLLVTFHLFIFNWYFVDRHRDGIHCGVFIHAHGLIDRQDLSYTLSPSPWGSSLCLNPPPLCSSFRVQKRIFDPWLSESYLFYFTWYSLVSCIYQQILHSVWVTLHCVCTPHALTLLFCWWASELVPYIGICVLQCYKHCCITIICWF